MMRIKLGDIFEINTVKGKAYLHYIYKDPTIGDLVRVLPGLHSERPANFNELAGSKEKYVIYFPLAAANKRKIVEKVGSYLSKFEKPKYMRAYHSVRGEFLGWHIIDTDSWQRKLVKSLNSEQKQLSPWGVWNDTLLVENLITDWSLENWT
ncbi:MAG: hypothetical protein H7282_13485 [Cytophagaceae bacterium]|nr:hypothetical protein [Cytophagaceae bacterium]